MFQPNVPIPARALLEFTPDVLWESLTEGFYTVLFEDSVDLVMTNRDIVYNLFFWEFHKKYPKTPLLSRHSSTSFTKSGGIDADTHRTCIERIYWDVVEVYNLVDDLTRDVLTKLCFEIENYMYNLLIGITSEYVTTIDALDIIDVLDNPLIKEANDTVEENTHSIENTYNVIDKVLKKDPSMNFNMFAHLYRTKSINVNQAHQCIGPRGFLTEVDGYIYKRPVLTGFAKGLKSLYDLAVESRAATKATMANDTQIVDSEYFSRRLQLLCMVVESVIKTDCGSTEYEEWTVDGPKYHNDHMTSPGDLPNLVGKYYLTEQGTLDCVRVDSTDLVGKTIKLRNVMGCKLENPHHVCAVCLGKMAENIKSEYNLGHAFAAYLNQIISQMVLSTKHLQISSKTNYIILDERTKKVFKINPKHGFEDNLYLNDNINLEHLTLVLPVKELKNLPNIMSTKYIPSHKLGLIDQIAFILNPNTGKNKDVLRGELPINYQGRMGILSGDFIRYIKTHGFRYSQEGNYELDMLHWDIEKPVFILPKKEYSVMDHATKLASLIETEAGKTGDPTKALDELFSHTMVKLNVNLSILEVIMYAISGYDVENHNHRLSRNSPVKAMTTKDAAYKHRSLSQLLVFERQAELIYDKGGLGFHKANRIDHPLDFIFDPQGKLINTVPCK